MSDDALIQDLIDSAVAVAEYHCGALDPKLIAGEKHSGSGSVLYLRRIPIVEVLEVVESWGALNFTLDQVDSTSGINAWPGGGTGGVVSSSVYAYSIDDFECGEITRRSMANTVVPFASGTNNISVTYRAGLSVMPPQIKNAVVQLVQHWYQNSLLRAVGLAGANIQFDADYGAAWSRDPTNGVTIDMGVPFRIIQQLRSHSRMPIIG